MNTLENLFTAQDEVLRWRAERENAAARFELAQMREHMARLLSQHEPVASMGVDRNRLGHLFDYVRHGDMERMLREAGMNP